MAVMTQFEECGRLIADFDVLMPTGSGQFLCIGSDFGVLERGGPRLGVSLKFLEHPGHGGVPQDGLDFRVFEGASLALGVDFA